MTSYPPVDVLALAAHPDDVELCCSGTVCKLVDQGYRVGLVDFTRGELGTRGTPEQRMREAADAADVMGVSFRENLDMPDGNIRNIRENQLKIIRVVRGCRPHIVLTNALECRHPDHGNAARLSIDACYYAGLEKIETTASDDASQEPWRPDHLLQYMQAIEFDPSFVVDVSDVWEQRMKAMRAFKSQFYNPEYEAEDDERETFISNPGFLEWIESRARKLGYDVGVRYGEGFLYYHGPFGVDDLMTTLSNTKRFK
jgi:bacillithiol biosynthesis deacetylase BshB1